MSATPTRIDAHVHFLLYRADEYNWITDNLGALRRNFLPEDLKPLLAAAHFDSCIAIEARQCVAENDFLLGLAETTHIVRAVVGWVDLCSHDVTDQVAQWASHPKFVGVRHVLIDEPDDRYMLRSEFGRGLHALATANLAYDLLVLPRHFSVAIAVIDAHPNLRFVLDHVGLPDVGGGGLVPWAAGMADFARRDNVACKLSALEFMADWDNWKPQDLRPYQEVALDAFGSERLMVGSNWPVSTVAGSYARAVGANRGLLQELSSTQQEALLGGTCQKWYRLSDS